ncbi:rhomboid family intramembrane serine protease [Georgenia subflava]|uniref:rhomboid family intramembrane serine protease n=1 Tax=Georgenia subflava TaxID=1622177 RepID=UPI00186B5217|nr:rhomboid family intramembrane serine protease [Georgenia subflava]
MHEAVARSRLTLTVLIVTAVPSLLQIPFPAVLTALQRSPAVRDGEVWRLLTSLVVQDGGWLGTVSNLLFLLVVGATAERVLPRRLWLASYVVGGLTGQLVGLAWQPVGAGNSVAVCGLAGTLAVALVVGVEAPRWTPVVVIWWCGALAATISVTALVIGTAAALGTQAAVMAGGEAGRGRPTVARLVCWATLAYAALLTAVGNVHGPPILVGAAMALLARGGGRFHHRRR